MDKQEIAAALDQMADLLELADDNPFRARSFRAGARALEGLAEDLGELVDAARLKGVKGIGTTLESIITELYREGTSVRFEELKAKVPPGLLQMLRISGLGPKRARLIHKTLGIEDLAALEEACRAGKLAGVPGFGEKLEKKLLAGIESLKKVAGRYLYEEAVQAALPLLARVRRDADVVRAEVGGSLRRRRETVRDIDIVASSPRPRDVIDRFVEASAGAETIARGDTKASLRLPLGIQADLRVVSDEEYPFTLLYFTGSKEHNVALRGRARARGLKLNEYGLFPVGPATGKGRKGGAGEEGSGDEGEPAGPSVRCASEEEIFRALGLDCIPPELREDMGEIDLAEAGRLPKLIEPGDLKGMVHVHTTYSDGRNTLEEIVEAVRSMGYAYLAISDHSQSAGYAGGLKEDRVREQHREIDRLNGKLRGFRIFKGIESDIRPDGSLDYPPEVLDLFDFVIGSIHSHFNLPELDQTARILEAMKDPHFTILGHPTGRLLLDREGYRVKMEEILRVAAELGVFVEINANPHRLDLDWRWGPLARELGIRVCIGPDAHSREDLRFTELGVGIARKAGFSAADAVNALDAEGFEKAIRSRRS